MSLLRCLISLVVLLFVTLLSGLAGVLLRYVGPLKKFIVSEIFSFVKKNASRMSQTEREALEAGESSDLEGGIFVGEPRWDEFFSSKKQKFSPEEKAFFDGPVCDLCEMIDDWKISETRKIPEEIWQFLRENGFFGIIIPKKYGGLQFSAYAHSAIVGKIATRSLTVAMVVMVPNSLGPAELLLHSGTDEQKKYYLPRLARGREIPCFALTEPEAGCDAAGGKSFGIVCYGDYQGKRVLGMRLTWDKRYITLLPVATVMGLAFKLYDPDHLLPNKERVGENDFLGITLALIPTDHPGVIRGRLHLPAGVEALPNGPTKGNDVFVPLSWIIGGEAHAGKGWKMLMECLSVGRMISLPAVSVAGAKLLCFLSGSYARVRKQFNQPIGYFGGVAEKLAYMAAHTYAIDALRTAGTAAVDDGKKPSVLSAIAKYAATEKLSAVAANACDVHGGRAVMKGPSNLIDAKDTTTRMARAVEGSNAVARGLIIYGQGLFRCHPFLKREIDIIRSLDGIDTHGVFAGILRDHARYARALPWRALFRSLLNGRLSWGPIMEKRRKVARYMKHINRLAASFAFISEAAYMALGSGIKREEMLSGRLADMVSSLTIAMATIKKWRDDGSPDNDLPLVELACDDLLFDAEEALHEFLRNFGAVSPMRKMLAWLCRGIVLPYGRVLEKTSDSAKTAAAGILLAHSPARDRLIQGVYVPKNENQFAALLSRAFDLEDDATPIRAVLRKAVKEKVIFHENDYEKAAAESLLDASDVLTMIESDYFVILVNQADDFDPAEIVRG